MVGNGAGWGIPITARTLGLTLGGVASKPGVVDGQVTIRDYLSLTRSFNHDLIDGAPAARFTERLRELIESGYGLPDSTEEREPAGVEGARALSRVEATRTALMAEQYASAFSVLPMSADVAKRPATRFEGGIPNEYSCQNPVWRGAR